MFSHRLFGFTCAVVLSACTPFHDLPAPDAGSAADGPGVIGTDSSASGGSSGVAGVGGGSGGSPATGGSAGVAPPMRIASPRIHLPRRASPSAPTSAPASHVRLAQTATGLRHNRSATRPRTRAFAVRRTPNVLPSWDQIPASACSTSMVIARPHGGQLRPEHAAVLQ